MLEFGVQRIYIRVLEFGVQRIYIRVLEFRVPLGSGVEV